MKYKVDHLLNTMPMGLRLSFDFYDYFIILKQKDGHMEFYNRFSFKKLSCEYDVIAKAFKNERAELNAYIGYIDFYNLDYDEFVDYEKVRVIYTNKLFVDEKREFLLSFNEDGHLFVDSFKYNTNVKNEFFTKLEEQNSVRFRVKLIHFCENGTLNDFIVNLREKSRKFALTDLHNFLLCYPFLSSSKKIYFNHVEQLESLIKSGLFYKNNKLGWDEEK